MLRLFIGKISTQIACTDRTFRLSANGWQPSRVSLIKVIMSVARVDYQVIAWFSCRWTETEHENHCLLKRIIRLLLKTKETIKRADSSSRYGLSNEQTLQKYCCW